MIKEHGDEILPPLDNGLEGTGSHQVALLAETSRVKKNRGRRVSVNCQGRKQKQLKSTDECSRSGKTKERKEEGSRQKAKRDRLQRTDRGEHESMKA